MILCCKKRPKRRLLEQLQLIPLLSVNHFGSYKCTQSHMDTQLQQRQQRGPVPFQAAFLHQTFSFRDECRVDAALRLPTARPPFGPAVCRIVEDWRIALVLTMTMNETLRSLSAVSGEGGQAAPQQQVNHLCPPRGPSALTR